MRSHDKNKTEMVVNGILSRIIADKLGVGDRLPSEEELGEEFGVSRLCVREALRGLKFLGVLETGTRGGTRIRGVDFPLLNRVLGFQIAVSGLSYREVLDARVALELGALEHIAAQLEPEQLPDFEALMSDTRGMDDAARDCAFHRKLLGLGGNPVLNSFSQLLEIFFACAPGLSAPTADAAKHAEVEREHREIIEALRQRNPDLARGLLRRHLERWRKIDSVEAASPGKGNRA